MNDAIPRPQAKTRKALTPLLEIRNLTQIYDGQHAVDDVSLTHSAKVKSSRIGRIRLWQVHRCCVCCVL